MAKLDAAFFNHDTLDVAKSLLGTYMVREINGRLSACRITETEAYVGRIDKACHAYNYKRTKRTETLFAPPGTVYIYLIYGMYHCLNFVTEPENEPCAVLIRSGEAICGQDDMALARFGKTSAEMSAYQRKNFLNGPGKLCKAFSLSRSENGLQLPSESFWLCDNPQDFGVDLPHQPVSPKDIHTSPRVGINYAEEAVDFPWRFYL